MVVTYILLIFTSNNNINLEIMNNITRAYNRLDALQLDAVTEAAIRDIKGDIAQAEFADGLQRGADIVNRAIKSAE